MKKVMKKMIILGMILIFCSLLVGCKEKDEEEKVGKLLGKLYGAEKAGSEKNAQRINKKIEELTKRQRKREKEAIREVEAEIGKALKYFKNYESVPKEIAQFSTTFEQAFVSKRVPWNEMLRGQGGKKYVIAYARVENVGSREYYPSRPRVEIKADNGSVHTTYASLFGRIGLPVSTVFDIERWHPMDSSTGFLKAGEKAWWALFSEIPEETTPIEFFGELGRGDHRIKFRLKLEQFKKNLNVFSYSEGKPTSQTKTFYSVMEEQKGKFLTEPKAVNK